MRNLSNLSADTAQFVQSPCAYGLRTFPYTTLSSAYPPFDPLLSTEAKIGQGFSFREPLDGAHRPMRCAVGQ
jgi:hypothetical protein